MNLSINTQTKVNAILLTPAYLGKLRQKIHNICNYKSVAFMLEFCHLQGFEIIFCDVLLGILFYIILFSLIKSRRATLHFQNP